MNLRTDLDIVQLPNPIPNWGGLYGANITQRDPNFGTVIVRLTDANTSNNLSAQTADEAEAGIWNTNDTVIAVRNTMGGSILYSFDPATMQGQKTNLARYGDVRFSGVNPNVFYELSKTQVTQLTLTNNNGVWSTTSVPVCDFANILPVGFKVNWKGTFGMSQDDSTFTVAFSEGVQETGFHVCVYRVGAGYRMLDTKAGKISGQWGPVGSVVLTSHNYKFPFLLHEANSSPNPAYATIGAAKGVPDTMLWVLDSLDIFEVMCTGHAARGMKHIYPGGLGGGNVACFAYTNVNKSGMTTVIDPKKLPPHYTGDRHFGFGKYDPNDASIIWSSSLTTANPFGAAWENEVFGYDTVAGVVYRACHTFNSGKSTEFITLNAMACASQTGRFVAFNSDMMGTLGSTTGNPQGTLGVDCRGDVFIVQVQS